MALKHYDKTINFAASKNQWIDIADALGGRPASFVRVYSSVVCPYSLEVGATEQSATLIQASYDYQKQNSRFHKNMDVRKILIRSPTTAGYLRILAMVAGEEG